MQFYIMMAIVTFIILVIRTHIVRRKEGMDPYKMEGFIAYYALLAIASCLWILTWPCLVIYGVIELITYLLDNSVLRKYLKKEKPE